MSSMAPSPRWYMTNLDESKAFRVPPPIAPPERHSQRAISEADVDRIAKRVVQMLCQPVATPVSQRIERQRRSNQV